eukprot:TRINITY_DN28127_c0_g1_i1.p2 TRINITY_DN28127_c0_g1~~TRINITY_DN28127_c0_g1_i1.p2  ORF type:complete len:244 (+),score=79.93 TRINITY_DN28127_c0_g1_i1:105-836(+)
MEVALIAGSAACASYVCYLNQMKGRKRVLVTGFNDWSDVQGDVWRCVENPTGMMLIGWSGAASPPAASFYLGPLPAYLRQHRPDVEWHFVTLPVVWSTSATIDYPSYDVVINLGLDGTLPAKTLHLEDGAYNGRKGKDAVASTPPTNVCESSMDPGAVLAREEVSRVIAKVSGAQLPSGFDCKSIKARSGNTFICNETNWRGLSSGVSYSYFVHVPPVDTETLLDQTAAAVGGAVIRLVDESV